MALGIYLLRRIGHVGYDEAVGFVVIAEEEVCAREMPHSAASDEVGYGDRHGDGGCADECTETYGDGCLWLDYQRASCVRIGDAAAGEMRGVQMRSFNAG